MRQILALLVLLLVEAPAAADLNWYENDDDTGTVMNRRLGQFVHGDVAYYRIDETETTESADLVVPRGMRCDFRAFASAGSAAVATLNERPSVGSSTKDAIPTPSGDATLDGTTAATGKVVREVPAGTVVVVTPTVAAGAAASGEFFIVEARCYR